MLSSIDKESVGDARRILILLCCARRLLTVLELIDGVAVELGDDPRLNIDGRLLGEDEIQCVCPGLIGVDVDPRHDQATVRIAHSSVQEYLESKRAVATFCVRIPEANAEITSICLTYLLEPALSISGDLTKEYPLALYAAKNWHKHYHVGEKTLHQGKFQALRLFQSTGSIFERWVDIGDADRYRSGKVASPVYFASLLRLDSVLSELLCQKPSSSTFLGLNLSQVSNLVNAQGGSYGKPLQAASYGGHETVIQLLLDKGADINTHGGIYENDLQVALSGGHEMVDELLADVDIQGEFYGTALQAASAEGYKRVVRLLLDKGADVNPQGGYYGTALQAASYRGREAVVRLLLDKGANINVRDGYYRTALQAASYGGYEMVIRLLLDKGADVNAQSGKFKNALQAALYGGSEAVVRLLLLKGAHKIT